MHEVGCIHLYFISELYTKFGFRYPVGNAVAVEYYIGVFKNLYCTLNTLIDDILVQGGNSAVSKPTFPNVPSVQQMVCFFIVLSYMLIFFFITFLYLHHFFCRTWSMQVWLEFSLKRLH